KTAQSRRLRTRSEQILRSFRRGACAADGQYKVMQLPPGAPAITCLRSVPSDLDYDRSRETRCGMDCPNCNAEIPVDSNYCVRCGRSLPRVVCRSCGHDNPPAAKFCANCGNELATDTQPLPATAPSMGSAERRQLTVMFCELAGSTELSVRL